MARPPPPEELEVLPPESTPPEQSEAAKILARWLDNLLRIPGTNFRIGLDPIMALFPGVGDMFSSSAGIVILLEGVRSRVSIFVLMRMGVNMLFNALMNLVPGLGTVGSAVFKSNMRNLALIRQWQEGHQDEVRRSSLRSLILLLCGLGLIVGLWVGLWILYLHLFGEIFTAVKDFFSASQEAT